MAAPIQTVTTKTELPSAQSVVQRVLSTVEERDPQQKEFLQAVDEVLSTLEPALEKYPRFCDEGLLLRLVEPERTIFFRVPWVDDKGVEHVNRGFRVQFSSAIGPCKGGLRFDPSVNHSVLKFLGFEQIFKNALTGLPLGGAKGGSDFNPRGRSDKEVMRFCQSFMTELSRHIGPFTDIPAGDMGVGGREIGYLFGQYKRIRNEFNCTLTGKDRSFGGSYIRPEATGYGIVYFLDELLKANGQKLEGMTVSVSGSGNVAQYCIAKLVEKKAKVVTVSDSDGFAHVKNGFDEEKLKQLLKVKQEQRGRIKDFAALFKDDVEFVAIDKKAKKSNPLWEVMTDIAIPCATQNEVTGEAAQALVKNGVLAVVEGANMPCTPEATKYFRDKKVLFGPAKAANAGGVAVSGLEMTQNSTRLPWTAEEVDEKLRGIMKDIHERCVVAAAKVGRPGDLAVGANVTGFLKVAEAMKMQGSV